jgi:lactate dehydrogenase-like 2-hydroxyacid dehydrogenase
MADHVARTVVVTDSRELLAPGIERLREHDVDVTVVPDGTAPLEAAGAAAEASIVIDGLLRFGAAELARLRAARLIIRAGIGYDLIDVPAATARGIWVANVPDYCADEVADHTLLLLLAATRRLEVFGNQWRRDGEWYRLRSLPPIHRPSGRVLGIVGLGRIGRRVSERARAFGWRIVACDVALAEHDIRDRGAEPVELDDMFRSADAITLHCPLSEQTHHLVDARRLALAKPGLVIVNTSRGGVVDIDALDAALASGQVSSVGLDVLEDEPEPDLSQPILQRENVIVTSHVAWYSLESRRDLALLCADEALRVLDGHPPQHAVNPDAR